MAVNLKVNSCESRVASAAALRQELAPFASEQFREIWVDVGPGRPRLCALMNTNIGWLMYLRHDDGDTGFSSRNPAFYESDFAEAAIESGLVYDGQYGPKHVPVIEYRLSNGQLDEFPAGWALSEQEIMRALEYFVEHQGGRAPFVTWHDDANRDEKGVSW
jgi:hypothetical protein